MSSSQSATSHFDKLVGAAASELAVSLGIDKATAWNLLYPPAGALGAMFAACPLCRGSGCCDCTDGWVTGP